jgi:sulfide:quinone oxidoreductase
MDEGSTVMQPKRINANLSVSDQIMPEAVAAVAEAGFRSIICNRPDGEGADQPGFAEIEAAAKVAGLQAAYQPVISGKVTDSDAQAFGALRHAVVPLGGSAGPTLAGNPQRHQGGRP